MIRETKRGSKIHVTSTFFDDVRLLQKSEIDTDYRDLYKNSTFSIEKLKLSYVVQKIILWKQGCQELSAWTNSKSNETLKNYTTNYYGQDFIEYEGPIDLKDMLKP